MPELPEVEVLARHLAPALKGKTIREVDIRRPKSLRGTDEREFRRALTGSRFTGLTRRGKYLLFKLRTKETGETITLLGHLGMTGRMYLQPKSQSLPKHTALAFALGRNNFVFEDTRYFGRMTLDLAPIDALGPEPLSEEFTAERFHADLQPSRQAIKIKLLDQGLVAGVGNIYACEALFRSGISPRRQSRRLTRPLAARLRENIRTILAEAIDLGSTIRLDFAGAESRDGLFYYGGSDAAPDTVFERFAVYDREGEPCIQCQTPIKRIVQAARSTFFCPACQRA